MNEMTSAAQIEAAQEFHANEMNVGPDAFSKFCADAEKKLSLRPGHLDGDEDVDGYSIDGAHDAFRAGKTVTEYVHAVMDHMAECPDSLLASYGPGDEIPGSR